MTKQLLAQKINLLLDAIHFAEDYRDHRGVWPNEFECADAFAQEAKIRTELHDAGYSDEMIQDLIDNQ